MLFHHLYLFQAAFSCHPLKFGLIRACNKDCMQGSGEGWGALCSNPKLEMFAEAGRAGRRGVSGRRGLSMLLADCWGSWRWRGAGRGGGVCWGRGLPPLPDPDGRGGGGARQEAKGVSGAGHVLPRGRSRRWRTPRGRRGVSEAWPTDQAPPLESCCELPSSVA